MLRKPATQMESAARVATEPSTLAVIGLGCVGLRVVSTCAAAGFRVVGFDSDPERVRVILGDAPDRIPAAARELRAGYIAVTHDPANLCAAEAVFICVPTPLEAGEARHEAVRTSAAAFARHGREDALVILESTVRPGFVEELRPLLGHGGRVSLAYAPERLDPQRAQEGMSLREIPRLVAGVDGRARDRAVALLGELGMTTHAVPLAVAEYAKLLENSYRLLNVAFIDQFAAVCRAEGVDQRAVIEAAATKPFGFHPFWPGVGAGGDCVAVDPAFLAHRARDLACPISLLEGALDANARRPRVVAAAVAADTEPGETVLVVGLTYKAGVPDIRQSAAVEAARALARMDRLVLVFDPLVPPPDDLEVVSLAEGLHRARAAVLLVPQPETVIASLLASGLLLFDATGTLPGGVGV